MHAEKKVTTSLGRSRDHRRKHHLVVIDQFIVWDLFTLLGVNSVTILLLTAHFDLYITLKHISNDKTLLWLKQCKSVQLHFLEMVTLLDCYHLSLRGHNFTDVISDTHLQVWGRNLGNAEEKEEESGSENSKLNLCCSYPGQLRQVETQSWTIVAPIQGNSAIIWSGVLKLALYKNTDLKRTQSSLVWGPFKWSKPKTFDSFPGYC